MKDKSKVVFVGLDVAKDTLAVSVADEGRDAGAVRREPNFEGVDDGVSSLQVLLETL